MKTNDLLSENINETPAMDKRVAIIIQFIQPHFIGRSRKVLTGGRAPNQIITTTVEKSAYEPSSP